MQISKWFAIVLLCVGSAVILASLLLWSQFASSARDDVRKLGDEMAGMQLQAAANAARIDRLQMRVDANARKADVRIHYNAQHAIAAEMGATATEVETRSAFAEDALAMIARFTAGLPPRE